MKISACIIAKNEENNIGKCLKSMQGNVDEIIVVDTGSTDRTIEVAKSYGAKVYSFIWQNDFSRAKNYALAQAKGDWIIFLDADEYFTPDGMMNALKNIQKFQQSKVHGLICRIINIDEDHDNVEMSSFANLRIFRNLPNLRYRYEVHEELYNKTGTLDLCMLDHEIEIYHTGYSSHIVESKLKRNLEIILTDIAKNGEQPRHYRYLLDCYHGLKEYDKAIKYAKLHIASKRSSIANESTVYLKMLYSMVESKVDKETITAEMKNAIKNFPNQPIFYAQYASFLLIHKEYDQALQYLLESIEVNKNRNSSEADSFQGNITRIYCNIAEILQLKNKQEEAINYFCQSLMAYKYNTSSFGHLYMLLYRYNEVEIIDILNRIYNRTKRDIEFIVKQLQEYPLNKTYVYYQNILKKEFHEMLSLNQPYTVLAAGKYQELYQEHAKEIEDQVKLLTLSLLLSEQINEVAQELLPLPYQNLISRIQYEKKTLTMEDFSSYNELLSTMLTTEENEEKLNRYLSCVYDFPALQVLEIADCLVQHALYQKAIPLYEFILETIDIEKNAVLNKLGYCYYKQELYQEAVGYFTQTIENGCTDREYIQLNQWSREKMDKNRERREKLNISETKNQIRNLTSIIILTYNQLDYTKLCIESIRKYTEKGTYEIIVVDNHSTDDTVNWLKRQKDIKTIFNNENKGFPAGCNQGIAISTGSEILLLNNDTIVTTKWLTSLKTALYSDEKVGAVGPVSTNCANQQAISVDYKDICELPAFAQKYNVLNSEKWEEKIKLVGFCMIIKRSVVDLIGFLDERFTPGNFEDDDYCFRIIQAGYRLLLCNDTFIHHFGSISFNQKSKEYQELLRKNSLKFKEKWGFYANYSGNCRTDIINLIEINKPNIKILEVGCACGATLLKIKYLNKTAEVHGIEICPGTAAIAKHFAEVTAENIENVHINYEEGMFDYIIFADVLEHLYQPQQVLQNIKKYLKPDGYILASIPNIMHVSIVKDLLQGNWTYQEAGILDKTHIRFFTLNEINKMFIQAEYLNLEYVPLYIGLTADDEEFIGKLETLNIVNDKNALTVYQYLVKAGNEASKKNNKTDFLVTSYKSIEDKQNLKFILRRIENDIDQEENIKTIVKEVYTQEYNISQIVEIINCDIYQKAKVTILVSTALYQQGMTKDTLKLLVEMYKSYPMDAEIVYALGFILNLLQDKDRALHVLSSFKGENESIKNLMQEIHGEN